MSNPYSSYYGSNDVIALQQLKDASLWFIIITLLGYIGLFVNVGAIVSIVSLILLFIIGIPKLRTAFQSFATTGKDVNNGFTGLRILPFGILISFIGGLLVIIGAIASIVSCYRRGFSNTRCNSYFHRLLANRYYNIQLRRGLFK